MAVQLFIARHGQNEDNVNGILNGRRDLPLTALGRDQAHQLAEGIREAGLTFDAIYCSPLSRAHETAQIVAQTLGMQEPVVVDSLIERDFGFMAGKPAAQIAELCAPDIIVTDTVTYFLHPEGAEDFPTLLARGAKAIADVTNLQKSGRALAVCHGDIGKMMYAAATGKDWKEVLVAFHFGNGELIDLEPNGGTHVIKLEQHNL
jgi:broad specificity phosphatase PhoE